MSAPQIASELGVSQPTVSRWLSAAGTRIARIGRARAARYALTRDIARAGSNWPVHRIDANGKTETLGRLQALHGGGFHFESAGSRPAFTHGDFASGLFPGLPWLLDDQRPQGFLGRAFAHRVAADIGAPDDPLHWNADDIVLALLRFGDDQVGDLLLGDAALAQALTDSVSVVDGVAWNERDTRYPQLAEAALRGEDVGSSAGGEQPKFAITLVDPDGANVPVIVKFSERTTAPAGRRWGDLLICEHHAGETLRAHGFAAAQSEWIEAGGRIFLQSTRFDRTPAHGRRGFVSLAALDAAYYAHGRIDWWRFAPELERDGWIDGADARRLRLYGWFGTLIGNTDMHLGNAALQLTDHRPFALAPAYDMLPMRYRPAGNGEVVARDHDIVMPTPAQESDWLSAATIAEDFWHRVGNDSNVSADFRAIADAAAEVLIRARIRLTR